MIDVSKVPVRDWPLYFNEVYMQYLGEVCKVTVTTREGKTVLALSSGLNTRYIWRKADLRNLSVWWPRPGAYNYKGDASYIARKATRCMRKSASPRNHYYVKYGNHAGYNLIRYLMNGPNHMSWPSAKEALDKGAMLGVAVCRDLIVTQVPDGYGIIYRGETVGRLTQGEYIPMDDYSPVNKLVSRRLLEEGIV